MPDVAIQTRKSRQWHPFQEASHRLLHLLGEVGVHGRGDLRSTAGQHGTHRSADEKSDGDHRFGAAFWKDTTQLAVEIEDSVYVRCDVF